MQSADEKGTDLPHMPTRSARHPDQVTGAVVFAASGGQIFNQPCQIDRCPDHDNVTRHSLDRGREVMRLSIAISDRGVEFPEGKFHALPL
jgi:hypothetical protein